MTQRGGNRFQGHRRCHCGSKIARGPRGRGFQSYQEQPVYKGQVQYAQVRNPGRQRGRGGQGTTYHANRQVYNAHSTPVTPSPTPVTSRTSNAPNLIVGEPSVYKQYMTEKVHTLGYKERQQARCTVGPIVPCTKEPCTEMLETGPQFKYCSRRSAHKDLEETKIYKETMAKFKMLKFKLKF